MKTLKQHIDEALKIGKNLFEWSSYSCQPKTKDELKKIIEDRISKEGPECDLNDIDVSLVTDMSYLFYESKFTGDISEWDVSKVKNMTGMFYCTPSFNCDISTWNINNVNSMWSMFDRSNFNQNISNWEIDTNCDIRDMFHNCLIKDEFIPKSLH